MRRPPPACCRAGGIWPSGLVLEWNMWSATGVRFSCRVCGGDPAAFSCSFLRQPCKAGGVAQSLLACWFGRPTHHSTAMLTLMRTLTESVGEALLGIGMEQAIKCMYWNDKAKSHLDQNLMSGDPAVSRGSACVFSACCIRCLLIHSEYFAVGEFTLSGTLQSLSAGTALRPFIL